MTRQQKYPETSTFHYHNQNPKNRITGDCRIRAISYACKIPYNDVVMDLARIHCKTGYDQTSSQGIDILLKEYGWEKQKQPRKIDNTKYTVREFVKKFNTGTYIINMANHISVVEDGKNIDIWDCVKYGGCVGVYWIKR